MKIKNYCLLFLVLFLMVGRVYAVDGLVKLDCNSISLEPGSTTSCMVIGKNFNDSISSFHAKISLGEKLELVSSKIDESWNGSAEDGIIDLYTDVNKSGNINFASFTIKAMDDVSSDVATKVYIEDIIVGDSNFKETKIDTQIVDIKISIENNGSSGSNNNDDNDNNDNNQDQGQNDKEDNNQSGVGNGNNSGSNDWNDMIDKNPSTGGNIFIVVILMISCILLVLLSLKKILGVK